MMMKSFSRALLSLALWLWGASVLGATPPAEVAPTLDRIIRTAAPAGASVGALVQSLDDGAVWYARHQDTPFLPASTTKVVTGALALEYLGPDYRFVTRVLTRGEIRDGVLHGDLYLWGGGDPSLRVDDLRALARRLAEGDAELGIPPVREVRGRLLLDESFFPRPGPLLGAGWGEGNLPWYYAAPSSALSLERNAVTLVVRGAADGKPATVSLTPPTRLFTLHHAAMSRAGAKTDVTIAPEGMTVRVSGRLAPGAQTSKGLSVRDPLAFVAEQMRAALREAGIAVGADGRAATPRDAQVLAEHASVPLADLLGLMMKPSDNHFAEQFRWTLLAVMKGQEPLANRFTLLLGDFLTPFGMTPRGLTLVDGSGLSRSNRISPQGLNGVLRGMATSPHARVFRESMSIVGVDGTLRRRMNDSEAAGVTFAKTGTIRGVSALAGYIHPEEEDRRRLAFSIFVNGGNDATAARGMQDRMVRYLAGMAAASAPVEGAKPLPAPRVIARPAPAPPPSFAPYGAQPAQAE